MSRSERHGHRRLRASATLVAGVIGCSALLPRSAAAFCRTRTSQVPADYDPCEIGACWEQGLPLYWANACVSYDLQQEASDQISYDDAAQGIATAFAKWTGTVCPTTGSAPGRVSIDVRDLGPVACGEVQYNENGPNQHVIVFRDGSWPYHDAANALALTTVTYDTETGEIFDADMEINTHDQVLSTSATVPEGGYDFESIVTHETGHFLGMAHSNDCNATMYAFYLRGNDVMRELTSDDVTGICSIYSPDGLRHVAVDPHLVDAGADAQGYYQSDVMGTVAEESCDPTPRHGFSTECMTAAKSSCSVALTPGRSGPRPRDALFHAPFHAPWHAPALTMLGLILAARRRARRGGSAIAAG